MCGWRTAVNVLHCGQMGQITDDTAPLQYAQAHVWTYACKLCIHRLSHTDLISHILSVFPSVSPWLSLSHLNPGSKARRHLRCFSWVKITFTLTWTGRSIPGVELKSGCCSPLSSILSHRNLPAGCRFAVHFWAPCLRETCHNQLNGLLKLVFHCLTCSLPTRCLFMWMCSICTFCSSAFVWFDCVCWYHLFPCLSWNLLYTCMLLKIGFYLVLDWKRNRLYRTSLGAAVVQEIEVVVRSLNPPDPLATCQSISGRETDPHVAPGGQVATVQGSLFHQHANVFVNVTCVEMLKVLSILEKRCINHLLLCWW